MASLFELVNQLAVRAVGRNPRWSTQEDTTGAPSTSSAGVNIRNAVRTLVQVTLREQAHRRQVRLEKNYEGTTPATITITIDTNDVVVDLGEVIVAEDELQAIADAINADATVSEIVTASVDTDQIRVVGDNEDDYTLSVTDNETGDRLVIAREDATEANIRVWLRDGGTGDRPERWALAREFGIENLDYRGDTIAIPSAGYRRMYIEVFGEDGDVQVAIGPGAEE